MSPSPPEQNDEDADSESDVMATEDQLKNLDQILLFYSKGDTHQAEGMKLTYMALVGLSLKYIPTAIFLFLIRSRIHIPAHGHKS